MKTIGFLKLFIAAMTVSLFANWAVYGVLLGLDDPSKESSTVTHMILRAVALLAVVPLSSVFFAGKCDARHPAPQTQVLVGCAIVGGCVTEALVTVTVGR